MKRILIQVALILLVLPAISQNRDMDEKGIRFQVMETDRKVDVYVDGHYFTSYIYPETLEKPVLYPILTAKGAFITRGFPLQPRPGERIDHPHQVGWWFNYGDVNGLDFWNNSYAIPDSLKDHYGSIRHTRVVKAINDAAKGMLVVQCQWVDHQNRVLLGEETVWEFSGNPLLRRIIRTTTLTAQNGDVRFGDNKEGLCALRVDRVFESPADKPEIYTDASGKPTQVPVLNNEGVNGIYRSSEGREKDEVWGKRASWVSLSANKDNEAVTVCIFDHPGNPGFPSYWHARGYGLFSVNNLAQKAYNPDEKENVTILKQGNSITFKHMLLIKTGEFLTEEEIKLESVDFSKK
jgi:hypothetical protein